MEARYGAISGMIGSMLQENFALVSRCKPSKEIPALARKIGKQVLYPRLLLRSLILMEGLEAAVGPKRARDNFAMPTAWTGVAKREDKEHRENASAYAARAFIR